MDGEAVGAAVGDVEGLELGLVDGLACNCGVEVGASVQ